MQLMTCISCEYPQGHSLQGSTMRRLGMPRVTQSAEYNLARATIECGLGQCMGSSSSTRMLVLVRSDHEGDANDFEQTARVWPNTTKQLLAKICHMGDSNS